MFQYKSVVGLLMSLTIMFVASCSDEADSLIDPGTTGKAMVRVVHASYDAPAVDIRIDGNLVVSSSAYQETSGYAEIDAGTRNVTVTPAGSSTPVVIDADLVLEAEVDYTVSAVGALANISAGVSVDNRTPSNNSAKVRFIHASPDAPKVDITLTDGTTIFDDIEFKANTNFTPPGCRNL